jgi:hypothetical protein
MCATALNSKKRCFVSLSKTVKKTISLNPYRAGVVFRVSYSKKMSASVTGNRRVDEDAIEDSARAEACSVNYLIGDMIVDYFRNNTKVRKLDSKWNSLPPLPAYIVKTLKDKGYYVTAEELKFTEQEMNGPVFDPAGYRSIALFSSAVCYANSGTRVNVNPEGIKVKLINMINPSSYLFSEKIVKEDTKGRWQGVYDKASNRTHAWYSDYEYCPAEVTVGYEVPASTINEKIIQLTKQTLIDCGLDSASADYWIQALARVTGKTTLDSFMASLTSKVRIDESEILVMKQIVDNLRAAGSPEVVAISSSPQSRRLASNYLNSQSSSSSDASTQATASVKGQQTSFRPSAEFYTTSSATAPAPAPVPAPAPAPVTEQQTSFQPSAESYAPAPAPAPAAVAQDVTPVQGRTVNVTFVEPVTEVQAIVPTLPPAQAIVPTLPPAQAIVPTLPPAKTVPADVMLPEDEEDEYEQPEQKSSNTPLMAAAAVAVGAALWFLSKRS